MPLVSAGVMAGSQILGGIMGSKQSAAAAKQSAEFTNKAIAELEKIGVPSVEAQKIALETPELVFNYVPQLQQEFPEIATQMENIETDPRLAEAQSTALEGFTERAEMGLTPSDLAELDEIRRGTAAQNQSQQAGILQNMAQRGMSGSGMELASRLAASQAAAQSAGESSNDVAARAFEAKQAALANLANVGTTMRTQDFSEQAEKANAADVIAKFNAQNTANTQGTNIDRLNQAELMKQQGLQAQEEAKANTANTEQQYNKGLIQQNYDNELNKAKSAATAYTGAAQQAAASGANQAANTQSTISGIGSAIAGGINAYNK